MLPELLLVEDIILHRSVSANEEFNNG